MAQFLLENGGVSLVVAAETAADAKAFAAASLDDTTWADAVATTLTAGTLDDSAAMLGWEFNISITGAAGQSADPITVSVTGSGTDDLDAVAAKLVTALNATEINGAAYAAPNLTLATGSGGDDLGDATVTFTVYDPSGSEVDLSAQFLAAGGITDGGSATDALAIALVADTETLLKTLATVSPKLWLVDNSLAITRQGSGKLIVCAQTAAHARLVASSYYNGDSSWASAVVTELAMSNLGNTGSLAGWVFVVGVSGAAGQTATEVATVTAAAGDNLADVMAKLVTALNDTDDIAHASYSAPNLTVATGSGGDDLGDATVVFHAYPPVGNTHYDLGALFLGTGGITHEGLSTAALTINMVTDVVAAPGVVAEV